MRASLISLTMALLTALISACATFPLTERPEIQAVHPRIDGVDFQGVNLAFDVDVDNPYPIPIRTPSFRYGIDIEGSKFFDSEAASGIDLPAKNVGTVTLPVRLSYSDLFRTYQGLADAPEASYKLNGVLIFPVLGRSLELPLSHSGTVPIIRPPTFSDINIDMANISLLKTKINVDTAMKNPNAFSLGIEDLGYVLKLGDVELGGLTATTANTLDSGQTGQLSLTGELSPASAIVNLIRGGSAGGAKILPSGSIQTPYGPVKLQR